MYIQKKFSLGVFIFQTKSQALYPNRLYLYSYQARRNEKNSDGATNYEILSASMDENLSFQIVQKG